MRAFFILAYPRSRTAWLAKAMTHNGVSCLHEGLLGATSVAHLRERMACYGSIVGNSDSANLLFMDAIRREFPAGRYVCVYRPEAEVCASLLAKGISGAGMKLLRPAMQKARQAKDVLQVRYDQLSLPETGKAIWEFCVGTAFDADRWTQIAAQHIESDTAALAQNVKANLPAIEELIRTEGVA